MGYNLPSEWDAFVADFNEHPQPYILKPPLAARGEGSLGRCALTYAPDLTNPFVCDMV
jgi:hypothetical protein